MKTKKRKNVQDATLKNTRVLNKRIKELELRADLVETLMLAMWPEACSSVLAPKQAKK